MSTAPAVPADAQGIPAMLQLLDALLDSKSRRRLELHQLDNDTLRDRYCREQLRLRNRDEKTYNWNKRTIGHFFAFLNDQRPTPDLARQFLTDGCPGVTEYSLYKYACVLRGFFEWYGEDLDVHLKVSRPLPPYIPDSRIEAFKAVITRKRAPAAIRNTQLLIIDLGYGAGLRRSEISRLRVSDLNLDGRFLIVRDGKGHKDRVIYLPDWLITRLRIYCENMSQDARLVPMSPVRISSMFREVSLASGVKLKPHDLRHAYATRLAEAGVPFHQIKELLGHADISSTAIYTGFTSSQLSAAAQTLDSLPKSRFNPVGEAQPALLPHPVVNYPLTVDGALAVLSLRPNGRGRWKIVARCSHGSHDARSEHYIAPMGVLDDVAVYQVRAALTRLNNTRRAALRKQVAA